MLIRSHHFFNKYGAQFSDQIMPACSVYVNSTNVLYKHRFVNTLLKIYNRVTIYKANVNKHLKNIDVTLWSVSIQSTYVLTQISNAELAQMKQNGHEIRTVINLIRQQCQYCIDQNG